MLLNIVGHYIIRIHNSVRFYGHGTRHLSNKMSYEFKKKRITLIVDCLQTETYLIQCGTNLPMGNRSQFTKEKWTYYY